MKILLIANFFILSVRISKLLISIGKKKLTIFIILKSNSRKILEADPKTFYRSQIMRTESFTLFFKFDQESDRENFIRI